jgi:hypothetical protein
MEFPRDPKPEDFKSSAWRQLLRMLIICAIILAIFAGLLWLLFAWMMSRIPPP